MSGIRRRVNGPKVVRNIFVTLTIFIMLSSVPLVTANSVQNVTADQYDTDHIIDAIGARFDGTGFADTVGTPSTLESTVAALEILDSLDATKEGWFDYEFEAIATYIKALQDDGGGFYAALNAARPDIKTTALSIKALALMDHLDSYTAQRTEGYLDNFFAGGLSLEHWFTEGVFETKYWGLTAAYWLGDTSIIGIHPLSLANIKADWSTDTSLLNNTSRITYGHPFIFDGDSVPSQVQDFSEPEVLMAVETLEMMILHEVQVPTIINTLVESTVFAQPLLDGYDSLSPSDSPPSRYISSLQALGRLHELFDSPQEQELLIDIHDDISEMKSSDLSDTSLSEISDYLYLNSTFSIPSQSHIEYKLSPYGTWYEVSISDFTFVPSENVLTEDIEPLNILPFIILSLCILGIALVSGIQRKQLALLLAVLFIFMFLTEMVATLELVRLVNLPQNYLSEDESLELSTLYPSKFLWSKQVNVLYPLLEDPILESDATPSYIPEDVVLNDGLAYIENEVIRNNRYLSFDIRIPMMADTLRIRVDDVSIPRNEVSAFVRSVSQELLRSTGISRYSEASGQYEVAMGLPKEVISSINSLLANGPLSAKEKVQLALLRTKAPLYAVEVMDKVSASLSGDFNELHLLAFKNLKEFFLEVAKNGPVDLCKALLAALEPDSSYLSKKTSAIRERLRGLLHLHEERIPDALNSLLRNDNDAVVQYLTSIKGVMDSFELVGTLVAKGLVTSQSQVTAEMFLSHANTFLHLDPAEIDVLVNMQRMLAEIANTGLRSALTPGITDASIRYQNADLWFLQSLVLSAELDGYFSAVGPNPLTAVDILKMKPAEVKDAVADFLSSYLLWRRTEPRFNRFCDYVLAPVGGLKYFPLHVSEAYLSSPRTPNGPRDFFAPGAGSVIFNPDGSLKSLTVQDAAKIFFEGILPAEAKTFKDGLELITYAKEQAQGLIDAGVSTQIISELVLKQAAGHIQFDAIIEVVAPGYGTIIYTHGPNGITRWNSQGKMIRNTDATGIIPMDQQAWSNGAPQGLTRVNVYDVQPDGTFLASHHILDSALGSAILSSVSSSDLKVNLNDYCRRNSIGGAEKERLVSIRELIDATFVEGSSKFCYDILVAAVLNSPVEHHHLGPTQCSGDIK